MKETKTEKKARAAAVVERLKCVYPEAFCALEWDGDPWKLLVMGRLSAQCTDKRVNIVCRELFKIFPTPEAMAEAPIEEIEALIRPCGLYHTKAVSLKESSEMIIGTFGGSVPDTMEELLLLPGVGRKIANLILGDVYHKPAVVTDTHCIRICGRLGFYEETLKEPAKVEKKLIPLIEPEEQSDFCHRIVQFGRDTCVARSPKCDRCPLNDLCLHAK